MSRREEHTNDPRRIDRSPAKPNSVRSRSRQVSPQYTFRSTRPKTKEDMMLSKIINYRGTTYIILEMLVVVLIILRVARKSSLWSHDFIRSFFNSKSPVPWQIKSSLLSESWQKCSYSKSSYSTGTKAEANTKSYWQDDKPTTIMFKHRFCWKRRWSSWKCHRASVRKLEKKSSQLQNFLWQTPCRYPKSVRRNMLRSL